MKGALFMAPPALRGMACSSCISEHALVSSRVLRTPIASLHRNYSSSRVYDVDNMGGYGKKTEPNPKLDELIKQDEQEVKPMLPRETVAELDRYIIGQTEAKRAVAVALRNRWRRMRLPQNFRDEVIPKNILMIGPTGVGKTEIARRLAKLISAPFIKVEATKFTEVGFHGRDVDQIIRDLVDISIQNVRQRLAKRNKSQVEQRVESKILDALIGPNAVESEREKYLQHLRSGELDEMEVEIDLPQQVPDMLEQMITFFDRQGQPTQGYRATRKRRLPVAAARKALEKQSDIDNDTLTRLAIHSVEQNGIVFIDEIDKICEKKDSHHSADASSEGVQRDLLPIIEGSVVTTKHGNVDTSHILFIASGAFHSCKPSDLISELQGRLPIRVELKPLEQADLYRILTEPETNQIKQHIELLKTEGVNLKFSDTAIRAIAQVAADVNSQVENIGARRLHTVLERIMEDISFNCDKYKEQPLVEVSDEDVKKHLGEMLLKTDLSRFIL